MTTVPLIQNTVDNANHPFLRQLQSSAYNHLDTSNHTLDLAGWVNEGFEPTFLQIINQLRHYSNPVIIEVGSWKGASAHLMATICKRHNVKLSALVCIDTWLGAPEFYTWGLADAERGKALQWVNGFPHVFYTFTKNAKLSGHSDIIVPFPISSLQGADVLRHYKISAHAIYIDASHESAAVYLDLRAFYELLLPGGIIFGDDYCDYWHGVKEAVHMFADEQGIKIQLLGANWMLRKPLSTPN